MKTLKNIDENTLFWDSETDGLSWIWNQVLSICGILKRKGKTLATFDESARRESFRIPNPESLLINNFDLDELENGQPVRELIGNFQSFCESQCPKVIIGHNQSFDHLMFANGVYQNLVSPDLWSLKIDKILIDTMHMARASAVFSPNLGIKIPRDNHGVPSFKLEDLCLINGLRLPNHSALCDVLATQELANLISDLTPEIFDLAYKCGSKRDTYELCVQNAYFISAIGSKENFSSRPLVPLGYNQQASSFLVFDLFFDPEEYSSISSPEIVDQINDREKDTPFKVFKTNRGCLIGNMNDNFESLRTSLSKTTLFRRSSSLRRNSGMHQVSLKALNLSFLSYERETLEPDELIFQTFPSISERNFINSLNLLNPIEDKWTCIRRLEKSLSKQNRFVRLGKRMVLENFNAHCPSLRRSQYDDWKKTRVNSYSNSKTHPPWETLVSAWIRLHTLRLDYPEKLEKINSLKEYYSKLSEMFEFEHPKKVMN